MHTKQTLSMILYRHCVLKYQTSRQCTLNSPVLRSYLDESSGNHLKGHGSLIFS